MAAARRSASRAQPRMRSSNFTSYAPRHAARAWPARPLRCEICARSSLAAARNCAMRRSAAPKSNTIGSASRSSDIVSLRSDQRSRAGTVAVKSKCVKVRSQRGHVKLQHMSDILISTMNDVPGYEVTAVYGEVYGLIVRARNAFSNIGAGFRTIVGGEAKGYTKLLSDSRDQAVERLMEAARAKGANAVLAMRFDCNEIGDRLSQGAAY